MEIKNYNSTLSLSDYTVGDVYIFYVHNHNSDRFTVANDEIIQKYSEKIFEIINDKNYSENDGKWLFLTRAIGVVIDKHKSKNRRDINKITVMFKTNDDRYVLNKYAVNSHDVFTNKKDNVPPTVVLCSA